MKFSTILENTILEDDWTYSLDDDDLREVSQEAIPFSRSMDDHLVKYRLLRTSDTSTGTGSRVFEKNLGGY